MPGVIDDGEIVSPPESSEVTTEERCFILETWNDPRDPAVSIARARVAPGVTTALHRLDVDERYIILEGRGRMEIEGVASKEMSPGDVAVIPAGKAQRIENLGDGDLIFHCICTPRFRPEHYHACE